MSRLSDRCRKDALNNKCKDLAQADAEKACKGQTGPSYGNCMHANFEQFLVKHCRDVVCPGDPLAVIEVVAKTATVADPYTGSGGGFTAKDQAFMVSPDWSVAEEEGGESSSTDKIKTMLFVGIGVILFIAITRPK